METNNWLEAGIPKLVLHQAGENAMTTMPKKWATQHDDTNGTNGVGFG